MHKTYEEMRSASKEVFDDLLHQSKEMILKLSVESIGSDSKMQLQNLDIIREDLITIGDLINSILFKLLESDVSLFKTHLEIETFRRSLFLQACTIKVQLEDASSKMRRSRKHSRSKKEHKTPSLSRSSSQGAENRKTPSPYPDFDLDKSGISSLLSAPIDSFNREDELLQSDHFLNFQKGNLTLPLGHCGHCVPLDEQDSLSTLAYVLNSERYYDEIVEQVCTHENSVEQIEAQLLSGDDNHFKFRIATYQDEQIGLAHKEGVRRLYGSHIKIHFIAYYPKQFHAIRQYSYGSHEDFLLSISRSQDNQEQLGKSGALFSKSLDGKYILKKLDEKEFRMFIDLTPNYFRHVCKNFFHNMPSRLAKTIGAYKISIKNLSTGRHISEWALLSENLGFNLPSPIQVYDLKGTTNHKRRVNEGEGRTKMDVNFIEDFRGIPLNLSPDAKRLLDATI